MGNNHSKVGEQTKRCPSKRKLKVWLSPLELRIVRFIRPKKVIPHNLVSRRASFASAPEMWISTPCTLRAHQVILVRVKLESFKCLRKQWAG